MAGHSKWKQIKHKKAITDARKGQLFSRTVREIMVAVREGGSNPETNSRLRAALERAKLNGLPKDNIERAIGRAGRTDEGLELREFLYEATAAGGVLILIEGITDNTNRSVSELKHVLAKHGARLAEPGSLLWNFEKRGVLILDQRENRARQKEEIELAIADTGALDFSLEGETFIIETGFTKLEAVRIELEKLGFVIKESDHDYRARNTILLREEFRENTEKLLEGLSSHNDVQEVYTNLTTDN